MTCSSSPDFHRCAVPLEQGSTRHFTPAHHNFAHPPKQAYLDLAACRGDGRFRRWHAARPARFGSPAPPRSWARGHRAPARRRKRDEPSTTRRTAPRPVRLGRPPVTAREALAKGSRVGASAVRLVVLGSSRFLRRDGARRPRAHDRGGAGLPKRAGRAACQRLKRPSPRHAARSTYRELVLYSTVYSILYSI